MDVLTVEQRRLNMSRVRGRDTRPELAVRKALHARGLRYRLHSRALPGCPDVVFPAFRTVLFVNGCFWHGHDCLLFKEPSTRANFWKEKIGRTVRRDQERTNALIAQGWRVLTVWECALRGRRRRRLTDVVSRCEHFIRSGVGDCLEIAGEAGTAGRDGSTRNQSLY